MAKLVNVFGCGVMVIEPVPYVAFKQLIGSPLVGSIPTTAARWSLRGWANGMPPGFEPGHHEGSTPSPRARCGRDLFRGSSTVATPRSERGDVGSIPAPGTF